MTYIIPHISDAQFINGDSCLSRRQANRDYAEINARGGFDAALFGKERFRVPEGFKKIPSASRSGALDPSTKSRFLNREENGEIELARDDYGRIVGWREVA